MAKSMINKLPLLKLAITIGSYVVLLLITVSCDGNIDISNQNVNGTPGHSGHSNNPYQIVVAVTDIAIGENRFAFAIIGKSGPLIVDQVSVKLSPIKENSKGSSYKTKAVFQPWPQGNAGVYISNLNFDRAGEWTIQVEGFLSNNFLGSARFLVNKNTSAPPLGSKPTPLNNLTINDVSDISELTTALKPDPDLYQISVDEALNNGMPTIISFASPSFCRSAICGPQIKIMSSLNTMFKGKMDFIHVEVYEKVEIGGDGNYEFEISGLLAQWGINSEPFTLIFDNTGVVVAKFEGFASELELKEKIIQILDI
ncbi:MAG: thioredoxin family protein [SAR202 cluster bacterium]|nr:thioredoxin family protein [SAR202 cluster bacterium]|tara:strand:+ start:5427 stop:6362 length:936 start_codon:yes stop_codon:yes gene_type:complete